MVKLTAESIGQRQRNLATTLQRDMCSMRSTFHAAPCCMVFYTDKLNH